MANEVTGPISIERVQKCVTSAEFWAPRIEVYGQSMRKRANFYAIVSALLSILTGLAVWTKVAASTEPLIVVIVAVVAFAAAAATAIPQIIGYGVCAGAATSLGPRYGHAQGELIDALAALKKDPDGAQAFARKAVEEFESVKAAKALLQPYPDKLEKERQNLKPVGG
jgi:hypothetical protein